MLPILLMFLLLAVDVGRVYLGWVSLSNIARIGANFAAMNPDAWEGSGDATVKTRYQTLMRKDATGIDCTLPSTLPDPTFSGSDPYALGSQVHVDLTCTFSMVTPFLASLMGDGAGHINVGSSAVFTIRSGSVSGVVIDDSLPGPTPTSSPTAVPTPTPSPTPDGTPDPGATPTPTPELPDVSFWGESSSQDASGGGPPGSEFENQIVGADPLTVTFHNTSTGPPASSCDWDFGDGDTTSSCGNDVNHTYTTEGLYTVTLTVDGVSGSRVDFVLVACKVPAFAGVRVNSAPGVWTGAGFSAGNFSTLPGVGNYKIGYQSLAGGLVNPQGGCDGATITVGP
jgi:PKD domain